MQKTLKRTYVLLIAAMALSLLSGCASNSMDASKYNTIVDVRTPMEFGEGHLKGAVNIDVEDPNFVAKVEALDKSGDYILYCHSGRRAGIALEEMRQLGFTGNLVNAGGFADAAAATGLPLVTN